MAYEKLLAALGNPNRLAIFERLRGGWATVTQIAADFSISRPAISQHLKVLKDAGLVMDIPSGKRRIYGVDHHGLDELHSWLGSPPTDVQTVAGGGAGRRPKKRSRRAPRR